MLGRRWETLVATGTKYIATSKPCYHRWILGYFVWKSLDSWKVGHHSDGPIGIYGARLSSKLWCHLEVSVLCLLQWPCIWPSWKSLIGCYRYVQRTVGAPRNVSLKITNGKCSLEFDFKCRYSWHGHTHSISMLREQYTIK